MLWEQDLMSWKRDLISGERDNYVMATRSYVTSWERDIMSWERDKIFFHMSPAVEISLVVLQNIATFSNNFRILNRS